jgi:hypothetical protein
MTQQLIIIKQIPTSLPSSISARSTLKSMGEDISNSAFILWKFGVPALSYAGPFEEFVPPKPRSHDLDILQT